MTIQKPDDPVFRWSLYIEIYNFKMKLVKNDPTFEIVSQLSALSSVFG
jgi:hypothetical protein